LRYNIDSYNSVGDRSAREALAQDPGADCIGVLKTGKIEDERDIDGSYEVLDDFDRREGAALRLHFGLRPPLGDMNVMQDRKDPGRPGFNTQIPADRLGKTQERHGAWQTCGIVVHQ
jgi:hypothetical protein